MLRAFGFRSDRSGLRLEGAGLCLVQRVEPLRPIEVTALLAE